MTANETGAGSVGGESPASGPLSTLHIGAAGELLVQYRLLKLGLDSARLTTDSGVDLAVYAPGAARATTVQVKAKLAHTPAGGRGRLSLDFSFPHDMRAEVLALVDLSADRVWLLAREDALALAQQHSAKGVRRLYWYSDDAPAGALSAKDLEQFTLEHQAVTLFS